MLMIQPGSRPQEIDSTAFRIKTALKPTVEI